MRDLVPQLHTALLQPIIQRCKIGELGHRLPKPMPRVPNVLLNLTLLPSCRRITELWSKHVVVRHGKKPDIDLPHLAAPDTVNCCLHVVVYTAPRNTAEDPERHCQVVWLRLSNSRVCGSCRHLEGIVAP